MKMPDGEAKLLTEEAVQALDFGDAFVVQIVRPGSSAPRPLFLIYGSAGLLMAFPFDSQVGRTLALLVGVVGVSFHRVRRQPQGELLFESAQVEDPGWSGLEIPDAWRVVTAAWERAQDAARYVGARFFVGLDGHTYLTDGGAP